MKRLLTILLATVVLSACGKGSPTAPSVVSFAGVWSGIWVRQSCNETGAATGVFCRQLASGPLSLTLTQNGSTVSGSLNLGGLQTPVSGPVSAIGTLNLTGQATTSLGTLTLQSWSSSIQTSTLAGNFAFSILPPPGIGGTVSFGGALQGVVRN